MQPSDVRRRALSDHAALRKVLAEVESLARRVPRDARDLRRQLRDRGEALFDLLWSHMTWEDANLAPALRDTDAWGDEREALLQEHHGERKQVLGFVLERLRDGERPAPLLAQNLIDFAAMLRDEMAEEERTLLDPNVLRDDVICVNVEAG